MLVADFEIIITKPFPTALMLSPFGFYGDILKLVYTQGSYKRQHIKFENIRGFLRTIFENISRTFT